MRRLLTGTAAAVVLAAGCAVLAGCSASTSHRAPASTAPLPPDAHTASALLKVAAAFNHDYDTGDYAPVYARWDPRSQAIISRSDYMARHKDCPGTPHSLSVTESGGSTGGGVIFKLKLPHS